MGLSKCMWVLRATLYSSKQCIVGSNSVVRGVFPDYSVIVGNPAVIIKKYNILIDKWEKTRVGGMK